MLRNWLTGDIDFSSFAGSQKVAFFNRYSIKYFSILE